MHQLCGWRDRGAIRQPLPRPLRQPALDHLLPAAPSIRPLYPGACAAPHAGDSTSPHSPPPRWHPMPQSGVSAPPPKLYDDRGCARRDPRRTGTPAARNGRCCAAREGEMHRTGELEATRDGHGRGSWEGKLLRQHDLYLSLFVLPGLVNQLWGLARPLMQVNNGSKQLLNMKFY